MDVFVARQPIFDRKKRLFAYELLFRSGMANAFPDLDGETATSNLLSSSFFTVGIEQISGGRRVFINFTEKLLLKNTPALFPPGNITVEILEDVTPGQEIVDVCKALVDDGYDIALDDFVFGEAWLPLIELAEIIKVDFLLSDDKEIEEIIARAKPFGCKLLAEKIETHEEFQKAKKMGFTLFQGYFFAKPEILKNKDLPSSQMSLLQLIAEINRAEFDIPTLEEIINQDLSVSFKLLKYLNSSYFSRLQPISSIRQAISFLGEKGIKQFVSLIATSNLSQHKPPELMRTSIIRARFLEQLRLSLGKDDSGDFFMLGLFSLVDAMLDTDMERIMRELPLAESVKEALCGKTGIPATYLKGIEAYETGDWDAFDSACASIGVDQEQVSRFYFDAVGWADSYQ